MNTEPTKTLKRICFRCEKHLEPAVFVDQNQDSYDVGASHATVWETHGTYGSAIFDRLPSSKERLELFICDDCLVNGTHKLVRVTQPRRSKASYETIDSNDANDVMEFFR